MSDPLQGPKLALRDQLGAVRSHLSLAEVNARAEAMAEHLLALEEVRRAAKLTAYISVGREPGTGVLIERLSQAGKRVLLPIVLPDLDLDWAMYDGPQSLRPAKMGLLEPAGERLGVEAVATADVLLVPGVGVDHAGNRIGRGGGCYDRALSRVPVGTFTCVLLNSEEVVDQVPHGPLDRRVDAVATELGVTRLG